MSDVYTKKNLSSTPETRAGYDVQQTHKPLPLLGRSVAVTAKMSTTGALPRDPISKTKQ